MSTTDKHKKPGEPRPPKNEPAAGEEQTPAAAPKPELTREQLEELRRKLQKKFHS
jgi:hypothetical protein